MPLQQLRDAEEEAKQDDYDLLPEAIQQYHTREEYLWMSDTSKARIISMECEPEW